ncbi:MAG: M23 family metallopeptidase [Verrucomicrobiota bacterium]
MTRTLLSLLWLGMALGLGAQPFRLPTANRAVLDPDGGAERYFVGTAGKPWTSGQFGCVRSGGFQLHEGLDIRPLQRDLRGKPLDEALCVAAGTVAYVNTRSGLSNYGNYVVVRHEVDRLEIFTLYAHLASVAPGIRAGTAVQPGQPLGRVGRTSNTRQRITPDRAHLHFEITSMVASRYAAWHKANLGETRNDHANFNGRNLVGLDPATVFRAQAKAGTGFQLARHLRETPELARVLLRRPTLDWVRRNPGAVEANPTAQRQGVAAWELSLGFNGIPLRAIPRAASEIAGHTGPHRLLGVNAKTLEQFPCGKLVFQRGQVWTLTAKGQQHLELLAY